MYPLAILGGSLPLQMFEGRRARKAAAEAAKLEARRLAVDADRQAKALLAEADATNSARLLAFERDALSQVAEEQGRKQALLSAGPDLSLSRDEAFTRAARERRRQSFFSTGGASL
jgi:hypothetical protein